MRRAAVGIFAGTLALTGGAVAAGTSPASALPSFEFERLSGPDRYGTAAVIAADSFPDGATTAIVARGDVFADALAASYLAGVLDAPILLSASSSLPAATAQALEDLTVTDVIIVGGTSAVSDAVERALEADYDVSRLGGNDRYLTAELIADRAAEDAAVGELDGLPTAILASGQDFPDALAVGPIAYAGNHPLLITRPGELPSTTAGLIDSLGIEQVVIAGQTSAVSQAVQDELEELTGNDAVRIGGQTRWETATMVADFVYDELGWDETHVNLARGDSPLGFADALTGGPHAGRELAPILLTPPTSLTPATETFLDGRSDTLASGHIFGGTGAINAEVETAAETAAQGDAPASNQAFDVDPDTAQSLTVVNDTSGTAVASDDRTYTASGLTAGTTYRIALVDGDNVQTSSTGVVTFRSEADASSSTGFSAALGADNADIVSVNNAAPTYTSDDAGLRSVTAMPVNGSVVFTIDGTGPGKVTPVLYVGVAGGTATTGGTSVRLETTATAATAAAGTFAQPAEDFGAGGTTTYIVPSAAGGTIAGGTVESVDKEGNSFTTVVGGAPVTFTYDADDLFTIDGESVDLAQFEAQLSSGDGITGTFNPNGVSSFALTNSNPATPTVQVTSVEDGVSVAFTTTGDVDSINVYRALSANGTSCDTTTNEMYAFVGSGTGGSFIDTSVVRPEEYCYTASAVNDGDEGARSAAAFISLVVPPLTATGVANDGDGDGTLEDGDEFVITFSEPVDPSDIASSAVTLSIRDADGTSSTITCNAACALSSSDTVLSVPNVSFPAGSGGTAALFQGDLTVTGTTGLVAADDAAPVVTPFTISLLAGSA